MSHIQDAYKIQANEIIKNLNKRFMEGYYYDTREEAVNKILSIIKDDSTISWGGSVTLEEIGIKNLLRELSYNLIDRDNASNSSERMELMKKGLTSNYFLTSTNAITLNGELVNIDGNGNRVAALCFGPDNVIVVCGMNKVVADIDSAIKRIKTNACTPNCIRLGIKTPCSVTGKCADCIDNSICAQIVVTRLSKIKNRIKVILVGESLGF